MSDHRSHRSPRQRATIRSFLSLGLQRASALLIAAAVLFLGFWGSHHLVSPGGSEEAEAERSRETPQVSKTLVNLSEAKVRAAKIHCTAISIRQLRPMVTVPATIEYDATRHVVVRSPVDCVVETVLAKPGRLVKQGEPLLVLSSGEAGLARNEIKKSEAALRIAELKHEWAAQTEKNVSELLHVLSEQPPMTQIEEQFETRLLGEHRDHLLTAYSKFLLANTTISRSKILGDQGIISGRTMEQRQSNREVAAAGFQAACELSKFESRRDLEQAIAELDLARRALAVDQDRLKLLIGPFADELPGATSAEFEIRAPFDARVEALDAVRSSRFEAGEPLLALADASKLWVSAQIHQRQWRALQVAEGQLLEVRVPALPEKRFQARVSFSGARVSPATRAVSLVAELNNAAQLFRPGMFAWVSVPIANARDALAVPESAIQRHEDSTFVFAQEGPHRYRCLPVKIGLETPDWVEITDGLREGMVVVDRGGFFLKSELLLEQEEE